MADGASDILTANNSLCPIYRARSFYYMDYDNCRKPINSYREYDINTIDMETNAHHIMPHQKIDSVPVALPLSTTRSVSSPTYPS